MSISMHQKNYHHHSNCTRIIAHSIFNDFVTASSATMVSPGSSHRGSQALQRRRNSWLTSEKMTGNDLTMWSLCQYTDKLKKPSTSIPSISTYHGQCERNTGRKLTKTLTNTNWSVPHLTNWSSKRGGASWTKSCETKAPWSEAKGGDIDGHTWKYVKINV